MSTFVRQPARGPADPGPRPATPGEGFERARRTFGLFAGPVLAVGLYTATPGLPGNQRALAAVLTFVITYWVTEAIPIPVTAVLGLALATVTGVAPSEEVFGAFSSSTIFLFIGGFVIALAMTTHGLDRRFALRVLSLPGVARSTYRIVIAFGGVAALLSAVISNTAATAMLFPIALGVLRTLSTSVLGHTGPGTRIQDLRLGTALMLMTAYGASVGGLLTPTGSPPNLIGRKFIVEMTGTEISFFSWMLTALPIVAVMFVALSVILLLLNRPEVRRLEGVEELLAAERAALGPLSRAERNTLAAFGTAVCLWVLPGLAGLVTGEGSTAAAWLGSRLDEGTVALLAAGVLFVLPVDWAARRFTLTWEEAVHIDWGTILLFGSGIALGTMLSATGLATRIGTSLAGGLGVTNVLALTALSAVVAVLISETTSNTASVGIVVPVVIPIAIAAGVDPLLPALAAVFGASYGFMLPVSTPPNAIVYGSGMVPLTKMIRSGAVFDVVGAAVIVAGLSLLIGVLGFLR
jgi:solute carrier family 13 (sodium-dependent dicarboxylate transporter), member 2/3/5